MLSPPQIVQTRAKNAAVIRLTIPRSEMMKQFGPAIGELMTELAAQGIEPSGAIFAHHLSMTSDHFDFELGVAVAKPVTAKRRVQKGELPAAKVARTIYSGPYEGLPSAWGEFQEWIKSNGHSQAQDLWEVYSVGPQTTSDPSGWRTELNRPLLD